MSRILFFIVLAIIIYFGWRISQAKQIRRDDDEREHVSQRSGNVSRRGNTEPSEKMVQCSYCGAFAVQSDSVKKNGKWYCCADHARKGAKN